MIAGRIQAKVALAHVDFVGVGVEVGLWCGDESL
jgi:hypothetical protein